MKEKPAPAATDPSEEIGALVQNLHTTHRRLQELTVGQVDAVIHPGGHAYLLHKAQEKLQLSEAVQRQLAETMSDILNALPAHIALLNAQGVIVSVNDIWRQFATANDLQGPSFMVKENYLEMCDRATGACAGEAHRAAAGIRAVLAGTSSNFTMEYPCHSPTEQRWFLLLVTPVRKDRPAGAVVMHIDITERKLAEEAVRESEERFRNMFVAAATGIAISTPQGRYLHANAAYCRMLGYTEEELRQRDFASLTHPDDLEVNLKLRDELLAGQRESIQMEKRYLKKNGDVVWTRHSVSATHGFNGEIATLMVVAEDITERKQAEDKLQRRQSELQVLFDLMPAMIWFKDTENGILRVNERAAEATGLPAAELEGKSMYDVYPQEAEKYYADDLEVIDKGEPKLGIVEKFRNQEGKEIWIKTDKVPVRAEDGRTTGIVVMTQDITERKLAEESLALFRNLIDRSPDAIEVIDPETGRFLDVNTTGCARLGYSREEMLALNVADIDVEKDYWNLWPIIVEELKKTGFRTIEGRHRRKDGTTFPVEVNARYINLTRGYTVAVVRDITERKLAEDQVAKQVELINMASRVGKLGAWAIEFPGPKIVWSDEVYRIHEVEPDFNPNLESALNFFPPGSREKLEAAVMKKEAYDLELDFVTAKGKKLWVRTTSMAETINGEVRLYGIFQDITERKQTEERFRRLVDSNAQGVFFWNKKGEITGGNDAFLQLVRYTREDLEAGRLNWEDMTPPEFRHLDQQALDELAATGICKSFEKEFILKDGSRVPILIGAAMFADNSDEGVCFILDLTERKKLEQQFLRAQRMESIGTLAGGIAHDLNNVLAPIIMAIDLLKMKFTDESSQELLATLSSSAQRGAEMVGQVLSFARGVEGRRMEVQVKHLLKDIEKIANDTFPKNIQVRSFIPNDLWTILGDPTQLHQVLLNLCVNARDAMPTGGVLHITAENVHLDEHYAGLNPDAHAGAYTILQVTDSGTGMPPGIIEKIFDPFFTTKEIGKGTGLGLSTSLAIVKSHGGFIRVYSEPGKGTTFKVYFPAQTEVSAETQAEIAAELPRGNGELILVVDDEANVRQITRQTLEAFGYRVAVAADGAEAVAQVARPDSEIAVVLTDMMMPVMDGPATIQVMLRLNPKLPIIAASGLSAEGRVTQAANLGVRHFLSKPYSADALLQVLRQILSANNAK
jgi:PAS domain S-box-containing protein